MLYDGISYAVPSGSKAPFNPDGPFFPRAVRIQTKSGQIPETSKNDDNIRSLFFEDRRRYRSWEGLVGGSRARNSRGPFAIRNCFGN